MADQLVVNTKYSGHRLDHPNFGDVQRTLFAKGKITDYQPLSDNPFRVSSMVKVQVEGYPESDFIPLFFCPKEDFWDDPLMSLSSLDYDEENKNYKMARQSFRGTEEEVVVLLQAENVGADPVPKFVIGFIDGYPRIGENIIKVDIETYPDESWEFYDEYTWDWQFSDCDWNPHNDLIDQYNIITDTDDSDPANHLKFFIDCLGHMVGPDISHIYQDTVDSELDGPDGEDMKLLTEVIPTLKEYTSTDVSPSTTVENFPWSPFPNCTWVDEVLTTTTTNTYTDHYYWAGYICIVGPFIYVIQGYTYRFVYNHHYRRYTNFYYQYCDYKMLDNITPCVGKYEHEDWRDDTEESSFGDSWMEIKIALATEANYNAVKSAFDSFQPDENAYFCELPEDFRSGDVGFNLIPPFDKQSAWPDVTTGIDWTKTKVYVRPHTHQELIDAGLLNADGSLPSE